MVSLSSLWLPIVLSAVAVFIASSVIHMVLGYHHSDFKTLPSESEVADALRKFNIPDGDYCLPRPPTMAAMRTPEFQERWKKGPKMIATFWNSNSMDMGAQLGQWFFFCVVVSLFAGYVASRALPAGSDYLKVSQIVSTVAFAGYTLARWPEVIWYKRSTMTAIKGTIDGLIFGFLTGGVFGWLWPH